MRKSRKKKKRIIQIIIMMLGLFSLVLIAGLVYIELKPTVAEAVTVEAGTESIEVTDFLLGKEKDAAFITDVGSIDLNVPGIYEIQLLVNNEIYSSNLEIVDTVPPKAEPVSVTALKNDELKASDFVTNVVDVTEVTATFATEPDTSTPGEKNVEIILEDLGKNRTTLTAKLLVLDAKKSVTVEAGSVLDVKESDFSDNGNSNIKILSDLSKIDTSKPEVHEIELEVDGIVVKCNIEVVDTTAPNANPIKVEVWKGETAPAESFAENISDVSDVTVSFESEPDFDTPGEKNVNIILEDAYGNKTTLTSALIVKEDTEPPVFYGVQDKTVYIGESVSYKKGVSVKDNKDEDVKFQVDSSSVNLSKEGTYTVYYTAVDSAGNKAEKTAKITVKKMEISEEELNGKVDKILARITNDSMTKRKKAWEIYKWVKNHIAYTGTSDKSDVRKEAYRGIVNGVGDCFTYYAVSEIMLTRAGIDNMRVTRVGGKTQHFWNLVNCGDGWYHFDACPNKDKKQTFMLTDKEVEEYTKQRGNNYYTFDKTLYPATPEK